MDSSGLTECGPDDSQRPGQGLARDAGGAGRPAAAARTEPGWRMPRRIATAGPVLFAVSAAAFLTAFGVAASRARRPVLDLEIYRWAGLLAVHSGNLYGAYFPHKHLPFTYPPLAALIFAALAVIPVTVATWLVTAGGIACLAATLWLTLGMLGYRSPAVRLGAALAATAVTLWLQPVLQTLWLGQVNLALMLVVLADLRLPDASRLKGAGVGLAAGVKLVPLIFIPYLLLTRRFRAAGIALVTFALTVGGPMILLPRQSQRFWFTGLVTDAARTGNIAYVGNQSLRGALVRLAGGAPAAQPYWLAASAAVGAAGLLLAAWAARHGQEITGILTCAVTGLLISPISWTHHWVWVAPALVVAADLILRAGAPAPAPGPPGAGAAPPAGRGRLAGWRRPAAWVALAAVFVSFLAAPEGLVPASTAGGTGGSGLDLLTGNLYVAEGLAALLLSALLLAGRLRRRARARDGALPRAAPEVAEAP